MAHATSVQIIVISSNKMSSTSAKDAVGRQIGHRKHSRNILVPGSLVRSYTPTWLCIKTSCVRCLLHQVIRVSFANHIPSQSFHLYCFAIESCNCGTHARWCKSLLRQADNLRTLLPWQCKNTVVGASTKFFQPTRNIC